jgi:hypothetical protein
MMTVPAPTTPAAAADSALTATTADLFQPPPAMTVEQAQAKRAELFGTAGFARRVAAGEPAAVKEWKSVTAALSPKVDQTTQEGKDYAARMSGLSILKAKADLPDEMWDHAAAGGFVSPAEKEAAVFEKQRLFKDKAFIQRYLDGERAANSQMVRVNLVLSSKIGSFDQIEAFKKAAAKRLGGIK